MSTTSLVFGLVASPEEEQASKSFDRLATWLRDHAELTIERKAWPTYRALADSVREGKTDVAWLPPVVYSWIAEGVTPIGCIARGGNTSYSAALVVAASSKLVTLPQLRGAKARAGWVDPWSAAGYVVPRIELARAGIDPTVTFASETFHGTHRDALLALVRGDCDVVGTYARIREGEEEHSGAWSELEDLRVRVLTTFGSIPSDVIAARRNLAPTEYQRAAAALSRASSDPEGRVLLRGLFGGEELRQGIEPGHEALRLAFETATAKGLFD